MSNMKVDARLVTAIIGVIAFALGWSEVTEQQAINEALQFVGLAGALWGKVFPEATE